MRQLLPNKKIALAAFGIEVLVVMSIVNKIKTEKNNSDLADTLTNASYPIPLWKDKSRVINLDRIFFELDDSRNNDINIYYNGL